MADLSLAQISAELATSDPTIQAYVDAMAALPADITLGELLLRIVEGARKAQATYNAGQQIGDRINAYNVTTGAVQTSADGVRFYPATATVTLNVATDLNVADPVMN